MRQILKEPIHVEFMNSNSRVKRWLENRPKHTQKNYGLALRKFCEFSHITPEEFQLMNRKQARDLAWSYIKTLFDKPSVANIVMCALKSFYRNHDGEILPFDSHRGGKHYFNNLRRKRAALEHIPNKKEVYEIIDMCASLRDRAIVLILFQSGIRVNALCRLTCGMVRRQLQESKVPLRLRITDNIDTKLRGYSISFYDTFIGKEAVEALKKYYELKHRNSTGDTPLFLSKTGKPMTPGLIWSNFKKSVRKSGLNAKTIWVHSIRKAFKKVVRKSDVKHDFGEALMGHVLQGSQENYFDRDDVEGLREAYMKIDFTREGKRPELEPLQKGLVKQTLETQTLKEEIRSLKQSLAEKDERYTTAGQITDSLWETIDVMKKEIEQLKRQKQ